MTRDLVPARRRRRRARPPRPPAGRRRRPRGRRSSAPATSIKVCFHADDLDAARSRLAANGVAMRDIHRYGDAAFCDGIDPEGTVFQLTTR